jgi:hypothetical protein
VVLHQLPCGFTSSKLGKMTSFVLTLQEEGSQYQQVRFTVRRVKPSKSPVGADADFSGLETPPSPTFLPQVQMCHYIPVAAWIPYPVQGSRLCHPNSEGTNSTTCSELALAGSGENISCPWLALLWSKQEPFSWSKQTTCSRQLGFP